jgi:hypothetical protein
MLLVPSLANVLADFSSDTYEPVLASQTFSAAVVVLEADNSTGLSLISVRIAILLISVAILIVFSTVSGFSSSKTF